MVLLEKAHLPLSDSVRQAIAMEMNLSETAFLEVVDDADATTGAAPWKKSFTTRKINSCPNHVQCVSTQSQLCRTKGGTGSRV